MGIFDFLGKKHYPNGDIYNGQLKNGCKIRHANGDWFEGLYSDGENKYIEGRTKNTYDDGTVYEGEIKNSKPEGQGTMHFSNGDWYEGLFHEGKIWLNGKGRRTLENGTVKEGEFKNANLHGHGILRAINGYVFDGIFKEGDFMEGEVRSAKGKFVGKCKDNKPYNGYYEFNTNGIPRRVDVINGVRKGN